MKKLFIILLIFSICLCFTGCSNQINHYVVQDQIGLNFSFNGQLEPGAVYNIHIDGKDGKTYEVLAENNEVFVPLTAIQMADNVTVELINGAKTYIDQINLLSLINKANTPYKDALLRYGHYAQIALSKENGFIIGKDHALIPYDNEVNNVIPVINNCQIISGECQGIISKPTRSLFLDSMVRINFYFVTDETFNPENVLLNGKQVELYQSNDRYYLPIDNIAITDFDKEYTITIGDMIITTSVLSYIKDVIETNDNTELTNAMLALYNLYLVCG